MRSVRVLALGLASLALVACASGAPGWTYTPAPPPTPVPSTDASGAPSASAPASADAGVVQIQASGIAFTTPAVTAPADAPFKLEFVNDDASVPHDVLIKDGSGAQVFKTDVFPGVATKSYDVPALAAGSYPFTCTIHPTMTGTLTAG